MNNLPQDAGAARKKKYQAAFTQQPKSQANVPALEGQNKEQSNHQVDKTSRPWTPQSEGCVTAMTPVGGQSKETLVKNVTEQFTNKMKEKMDRIQQQRTLKDE